MLTPFIIHILLHIHGMTSEQVWTCQLAGPCAAMSAFWLIFFSDKSDSVFDKFICHCLSCWGLPIKGKKLSPLFFWFYIGFPCFARQNVVFLFPGFSFVHSYELWSFRWRPDACFAGIIPLPRPRFIEWIHVLSRSHRGLSEFTELFWVRSP